MVLTLIVSNTENDLRAEKIRSELYRASCPSCGKRWQTTVGYISDNPHCPRCRKPYDFREK
jgi:endogenous inhibitor of DNA gyrase (YacG/DUF329 family)